MQGHSHDIVDQKKSPCHHKDSGNEIADRPRVGCIHPGGIVGQIGGKSHLAKAQIRNDLLRLGIQIFRMPQDSVWMFSPDQKPQMVNCV